MAATNGMKIQFYRNATPKPNSSAQATNNLKAQLNSNTVSEGEPVMYSFKDSLHSNVSKTLLGIKANGGDIQIFEQIGKTSSNGGELFNTAEEAFLNAHAEGGGTVARGQVSHAEGDSTTTYAIASHAEGDTTQAGGWKCIKGYQGTTSPNVSHKVGDIVDKLPFDWGASNQMPQYWQQCGAASHAEGSLTKSLNDASHAEGDSTIASGDVSHAEGNSTTASGDYSHAEGWFAIASGLCSHAEGHKTRAMSNYASATGTQTTAYGNCSHAEGISSTSIPDETKLGDVLSVLAAWGQGNFSLAHGTASHVSGRDCLATGTNAFASGNACFAPADNSHVFGAGLASSTTLIGTVVGNYNNPSPNNGGQSKNYFTVGGGTSNKDKKNLMEVWSTGVKVINGTVSKADYAEMFEWEDGNPQNEDRVGLFVELAGTKIRPANGGYLLGIVSSTPGIVGNEPMQWPKKYSQDDWGRTIYDEIQTTIKVTPDGAEVDDEFIANNPDVEVNEVVKTTKVPQISPDYNSSLNYEYRSHRQEWSPIGMMGQLKVRQDGTLKIGGFCKPSNGIATSSKSGYYVMDVINNEIALILFK